MAATGRKRVGTAAKKAMAAPLLAAKIPHAMIAKMLEVSERTVSRWAGGEDVQAAAAEVAQRNASETESRIRRLVDRALATVEASMEAEDDRVRLDAAKTTLDRFGHPVQAKSETTVSGPGGGPVASELRVTVEVARELAKEGGE